MDRSNLGIVLTVMVVLCLLAFGCYVDYKVWKECRVDHSWFYCSKVLSR